MPRQLLHYDALKESPVIPFIETWDFLINIMMLETQTTILKSTTKL